MLAVFSLLLVFKVPPYEYSSSECCPVTWKIPIALLINRPLSDPASFKMVSQRFRASAAACLSKSSLSSASLV